jgi:CelD/BcsL family acetyltransferase involved in cellulose biosynthesis
MTTISLGEEPACPGSVGLEDATQTTTRTVERPVRVIPRRFDEVSREAWDSVAAANPWATPFSGWAFQRAWWDAYGGSAHDQTLTVVDGESGELVAIVPLMHRHEVEPTDAATNTKMRMGHSSELTPVPPTAKAIFFGASYHADYATILAKPSDMPIVADAVAAHLAAGADLADPHPAPWDVIDLRRLRCGDPAAEALADALGRREISEGWTLNVEREDVCPVLSLPAGGTFDDYLGTLDKKGRHEIRRKIRRAEAHGEVRLVESSDPLVDLETFAEFHQGKWGERGLFPATPGGDASRRFFRRLFEEHGPDGVLRLSFLTVGERRIAAGVHLRTADGYLYYNGGVDVDARELSPGVLMVAAYIQQAIGEGCRRFDFLRGDEPYKYEWGAVDEPIQRILVRRDIGEAAEQGSI